MTTQVDTEHIDGILTPYKETIGADFQAYPNAGFHRTLARLAGRWALKHPLNPAPMMKW